ncbi:MAG: hypothetical protein IPL88_12230 [Rhizobiales bacterium]|nr:hypothetical protein [Hyphomicrobiales bacterium]
MTTTPDPLICDLVEWLAAAPRTRAEVVEAWRSSCPRLTIIEDAMEGGSIERAGAAFAPTPAGRALAGQLRAARREA